MGKKNKTPVFRPPLRRPPMSKQDAVLMDKIKSAYQKEMTEASNNAFNLALSSALIAARDMGMSKDEVKEMLQRVFGVLDDVADGLARIEEMLRLIESWGIEIHNTTEKKTQESGAVIEKKTAVFYLLQQGYTEIEDILTQCKLHNVDVDYRDVCSFRWEFNKRKYYEELEADMSGKEAVFKLLDEGITDSSVIAEKTGLLRSSVSRYKYIYNMQNKEDSMAKNSQKALEMLENGASKDDLVKELGLTEAAAIRFVDKYNEKNNGGEIEVITNSYKKQAFDLFDKAFTTQQVRDKLQITDGKSMQLRKAWIDENKKDLTTEEMSAILLGEDATMVILRHKGVLPKKESAKDEVKETIKKHYEAPETGKGNEESNKAEEQKPEVEREKSVEVNPEIKSEYKYVDMGQGLKKKVRVIETVEGIEGEFATYTPSEDIWNVEIDGQVITMNRQSMKTLGQELLAVSDTEI